MIGSVHDKSLKTIVMYTDFSYGKQNPTGGTKRYLELIYGLIKKGNTVHLFIPKDAELKTDDYLIRHDIRRCSVSSFLIPNGLINFVVNFKNLSAVRKINYDAIILFDVPCSAQFMLLRLKKLYLFIRQDFIEYRKISIGTKNFIKEIYLAVLKKIERAVLLHAHRIVVQCQYDKNVLLKRHDRFKSLIQTKMFVLNNNVNPSWITSKEYVYNNREMCDNIKLCFVGDINNPRKGFGLLMDAVSILLDEGENLSLDVVGGGQLLDHYRSHYKSRDNIKFWGRLNNPLRVINECDLLVVPSLADSFPNTIMEAFYLELPVIGSDVGGIPEMLRCEDLIFSPNITDLVAKLRDIIYNVELEVYREYSKKRKKELTFDWVEKVFDLIQ